MCVYVPTPITRSTVYQPFWLREIQSPGCERVEGTSTKPIVRLIKPAVRCTARTNDPLIPLSSPYWTLIQVKI